MDSACFPDRTLSGKNHTVKGRFYTSQIVKVAVISLVTVPFFKFCTDPIIRQILNGIRNFNQGLLHGQAFSRALIFINPMVVLIGDEIEMQLNESSF